MNIIIKVGSGEIVSSSHKIKLKSIEKIINLVIEAKAFGFKPILIISGAISIGKKYVNSRNAAAAIGQQKLICIFENFAKIKKLNLCQILVNNDNTKELLQTIKELIENNFTPIINENDVISNSNNTFGNNDYIASTLGTHLNCMLLF